jgi:hypothetical protein
MEASKLGSRVVCVALALAPAACNVESTYRGTGGISLDGGVKPDGGGDAGDAAVPVEAALRGWAVMNTDYTASSIVSLLAPAGEVKSASFIGSGSVKPGLFSALSGDVVLPTTRMSGDELVLIDRKVSVLTFVKFQSPAAPAQLSVATGFNANPHDYVPYSPTKAFVTRYEPNLDAGKEPFDSGNDVLVIDPSKPEITGSIDMVPATEGSSPDLLPRASSATLIGGKLRVFLNGINKDFTEYGDSRVVSIDPESNAITQVLVFAGLVGCGGPTGVTLVAGSHSETKLAVGCTGRYGSDPSRKFADSGLVILDVQDEFTEERRFTAKDWGIGQIQGVAWTSDSTLLVSTSGRFDADQTTAVAQDAVRFLDLASGDLTLEPLLASKKTPFTLGDVHCDVSDRTCLVADAETNGGVVQVVDIDDAGGVRVARQVKIDTGTGLPPRYLGTF